MWKSTAAVGVVIGSVSIEIEQIERLLDGRTHLRQSSSVETSQLTREHRHRLLPARFHIRRRFIEREQHVPIRSSRTRIALPNLTIAVQRRSPGRRRASYFEKLLDRALADIEQRGTDVRHLIHRR